MTYEATNHAPLPSENLLCDGTSYDLGWDEQEYISSQVDHESVALPSADHALYLINTVQFHCGQLFYLLDEYEFMQCFYFYHEDGSNRPGLWYIHYLLILAFGKAFVVQNSKGQRPPGADLFLLAMNLLPPAHFFVADAVRMVQVLCCAALYLQCIEFRGPAYRIVSSHKPLIDILILNETDWPGTARGSSGRTAHRNARYRCRRDTRSKVSPCMVDSLHPRPPDVIPNGSFNGGFRQ